MLKFVFLDHYIVNGKRGFYVKNIKKSCDFNWLIGENIIVDGHKYKVTGVKRSPHSPPWNIGEEVGLMVDEIKQSGMDRNEFRGTINNV